MDAFNSTINLGDIIFTILSLGALGVLVVFLILFMSGRRNKRQ